MEKAVRVIQYYRRHISQEDTTSLSYYLLLSLIPSITVIAFMSQLLHIDLTFLIDLIHQVFNAEIAVIIENALFDRRISYLSAVTIFLSVFVCSKGVYRLIKKVNELYHHQCYFYLKLRIHALLDTLLVLVLVLGLIVIMGIFPFIMRLFYLNAIVYFFKYAGGFIFLFLLLLAIFYLVPLQKVKIKEIWLGTLVSTILFVLIIFGFNIYLNFVNYSNIYGSFASIAVLLLTCDFFAKGLYLGFVINALRKNVE